MPVFETYRKCVCGACLRVPNEIKNTSKINKPIYNAIRCSLGGKREYTKFSTLITFIKNEIAVSYATISILSTNPIDTLPRPIPLRIECVQCILWSRRTQNDPLANKQNEDNKSYNCYITITTPPILNLILILLMVSFFLFSVAR